MTYTKVIWTKIWREKNKAFSGYLTSSYVQPLTREECKESDNGTENLSKQSPTQLLAIKFQRRLHA